MTLYLHSIAHFVPENRIDSELITKLSPAVTKEEEYLAQSIRTRATTLPLDYINTTKNQDLFSAEKQAQYSATSLGVSAAKDAIKKAKINASDIGLVLAGSATPHQTIPTESQRIAGALGMKTNAYDVTASSGEIALHLNNLLRWKDERVPDYVLCITTNTPTQRVDYSSGLERFFLGDGAVALIVSTRNPSGVVIETSDFAFDFSAPESAHVKIYEHIEMNSLDFFSEKSRKQIEFFSRLDFSSDVCFIDNQYPLTSLEPILKEKEIVQKHYTVLNDYGFSLSSSPFITLSEAHKDFDKGSKVVVMSAGVGAGTGTTVFNWKEGL